MSRLPDALFDGEVAANKAGAITSLMLSPRPARTRLLVLEIPASVIGDTGEWTESPVPHEGEADYAGGEAVADTRC